MILDTSIPLDIKIKDGNIVVCVSQIECSVCPFYKLCFMRSN